MKIYVASSWRNERHPDIVALLRAEGHDVYDFKNPPYQTGFHWSEVGRGYKHWCNQDYREALKHPIALAGFDSDMSALRAADCTVLVMPCGNSAHLELGFAVGQGKRTAILLQRDQERVGLMNPELMYLMADLVTDNQNELTRWLGGAR